MRYFIGLLFVLLFISGCRKIFKGEIAYHEYTPAIELITLDSIVDNSPMMVQGVQGFPECGSKSAEIDMNDDGINDFKIVFSHENYSSGQGSQMSSYSTGVRRLKTITGLRSKCSIATDTATYYIHTFGGLKEDQNNYAYPFPKDQKICKSKEWNNSVIIGNANSQIYIGVQFDADGKQHFGWIYTMDEAHGMRVLSKAYNKKTYRIKAGQTK